MNFISRFAQSILTVLFLQFSTHVLAIEIVIDDYVLDPIPVAIVPFAWNEATAVAPTDVASVVRNDLKRSGRFKTLDETKLPETPSQKDAINFRNWRMSGMDNLLIGEININDAGDYIVIFQLFNVHNQEALARGQNQNQASTFKTSRSSN